MWVLCVRVIEQVNWWKRSQKRSKSCVDMKQGKEELKPCKLCKERCEVEEKTKKILQS